MTRPGNHDTNEGNQPGPGAVMKSDNSVDVSEPSQIPCQGEAAGAIYFYLQDQGFSFLLHSEMRPVAGGMGVGGVKASWHCVSFTVFGWPTGLFLLCCWHASVSLPPHPLWPSLSKNKVMDLQPAPMVSTCVFLRVLAVVWLFPTFVP